MGAAAAFVPLAAAALPFAANALGFGQQRPQQPAPVQPAQQTFRAPEPPAVPTLADASVERARRRQTQTPGIRASTVRTGPQGLLDDTSGAVAGASLLA